MSRPRPAQKKSNVALLTEGQSYIQRAKKARREQVEEIKFDDEARREWLTGFSKRKKAKSDEKRARAKERDKQTHLDDRRKARQELKERAAENVKTMRKAMGLVDEDDNVEGEDDGEDEEDDAAVEAGPSKIRGPGEHQEAEYSDEDQLAIVTITEDFDPSTFSTLARKRVRSPDSAFDEDDEEENSRSRPREQEEQEKKAQLEKSKAKAAAMAALPPSSGKLAKLQAKKKEKAKEVARSRSMETNSERRKGRELEAKRRGKKAAIAMERDGRARGLGAARGGGKGARGGGKGRGGGRGGKR